MMMNYFQPNEQIFLPDRHRESLNMQQ